VFKFLTTKPLWVNIVAGIVLLLLILLLFLGSLALLTRHGKTMKIPAVTGMSFAEAKKTLETQGFEVQIQDSVYFDTMPPLQVVKQFPESDDLVKVNRTVYLTINRAEAPFINMPNLVSMSFRTADMMLKQYGLKLEDTIFKPDFAKNSVLQQLYKGENVKPGIQIQQGSAITLVLGNGVGGTSFIVPDLTGLTYRQVKAWMDSTGVIIGAVVVDPGVTDTPNSFVTKQNPQPFNADQKPNPIRPGQSMDIYLGSQRPVRKSDTTASPAAPSGY
jgi:beta-lactam-binding protein with PASTA domain